MTWAWDSTSLADLEAFLRAEGLYSGPPNPRRIGDGHSNLTYLIDVAGGQAVLRRPPPPPIPKGANDVLREARILTALQDQPVPTARVLAVAEPGAVLDVPFYIMDHVAGHVLTTDVPKGLDTRRHGPDMAAQFVGGLAGLHAVDWQAAGLHDFGRPENFNARHLDRLRGLMDLRDGPTPAWLSDVADDLARSVPAESAAAIVHNDYRLGNVIWSGTDAPKLAAVLDWELATIGDPLLDVGYMICCYPQTGQDLNPTQELSTAFLLPGFPTRAEVIDMYARASGRTLTNLAWYAAMTAWKLAVLYDYQHRQGRDAYYADATQAPRFIAAAETFLARG